MLALEDVIKLKAFKQWKHIVFKLTSLMAFASTDPHFLLLPAPFLCLQQAGTVPKEKHSSRFSGPPLSTTRLCASQGDDYSPPIMSSIFILCSLPPSSHPPAEGRDIDCTSAVDGTHFQAGPPDHCDSPAARVQYPGPQSETSLSIWDFLKLFCILLGCILVWRPCFQAFLT